MNLKVKDEIDSITFDNLMEKMEILFVGYHVWPPT
jgi:hypothetical protein